MKLKVGVIGAGTVGGGIINLLLNHTEHIKNQTGVEIELKHIVEIKPDLLKPFELNLNNVMVSSDIESLLNNPEIDVVCELIGGIEPAKTFIIKSLKAGKHVVTANKMLLSKHGEELCKVAQQAGKELRYEAAVGGVIPIIKVLKEVLSSTHVETIYGIVNGTCNYILSRMTYEGLDFDTVLKEAQANGYAETPPDLDIKGLDTAHKCQILTSLCFGTPVLLEDIYVEGITEITHSDVVYANEMGYVIKLLAIARKVDGEIEARVHPTFVPQNHLLASVRNEYNAIYVESDMAGPTLYYGKGAGRFPTATAVISDLLDLAKRKESIVLPPFIYYHELNIRDIGLLQSRYYLRFTTKDYPGVLGQICTVLGKHHVSISSCHQKETLQYYESFPVHVIIITHESLESSIQSAVAEINQLECIVEPTHIIRMLS
ncbi:MAG TPA: homoserine dehydrogenase [Candidatus Hydrogenedens sp.]|nr:homoserine dehydrogenase [Candidatus Hydrogenedens sp.]